MFRFLKDDAKAETVTVYIDGSAVTVPRNISVAAAVLAQGIGYTRTTPVSNAPRAPFCMMGVCYDCLMIIDGKSNCRACQETVADGMRIERQQGAGPES